MRTAKPRARTLVSGALAGAFVLAGTSVLALALAGCCPPPQAGAAPVAGPPPGGEVTPVATPTPPAPAPAPVADVAFPADAYRAAQPAPGPLRPFAQPAPERFKLANGVEVFLVERHELPTVTMELSWDYGAVADPPGKEGLASLCMGLVNDGTKRLDKIAYAEALADLGAHVSSSAGRDQQSVSLATLARNLEPALDLWAEAILQPGLRAEDLDRAAKRRLAELEQMKGSAQAVGGRLRAAVVFGERHPYGRFATEASTRAITVEDCRRHVARSLRPAGARLFVVGDITRAGIEEKVGARLAAMKGRAPALPRIGKPAPPAGRVFLVDIAGSPQSMIFVQHPGPARTAPDYFATSLMNSILGGSFSSRINMNLRERRGWAYGARSSYAYQRQDSVFVASASVQADATGPAVGEIVKEMQGLRDADASDAELAREKEGAILGLPARFATGQDILSVTRELVYYGLPLDWYANYVPGVEAVKLPDVRAAAGRHLRLADVRVLVAGDAATALPQLAKLVADGVLPAGDVVLLDVDGKRLPGRPATPGAGAKPDAQKTRPPAP